MWEDIEKFMLIGYVGNADREQRMQKEFARIGLNGKVQTHWSFDNAFLKPMQKAVPVRQICKDHPGMLNCTICHYSVLKTCLQLGLKNVMIFEDDCRFVKDISRIERAMAALPRDYDLALLDWFYFRPGGKVNEYWSRGDRLRSAACYICSQAGMRRLVSIIEESPLKPGDSHKLRAIDEYFESELLGRSLNFYCATTQLAIQQNVPVKCNAGMTDVWSARYARFESDLFKHKMYQEF